MEKDFVMFEKVPQFLGHLLLFYSIGAASPRFFRRFAPLSTKKNNSKKKKQFYSLRES